MIELMRDEQFSPQKSKGSLLRSDLRKTQQWQRRPPLVNRGRHATQDRALRLLRAKGGAAANVRTKRASSSNSDSDAIVKRFGTRISVSVSAASRMSNSPLLDAERYASAI
jgi:hypothetical protein